MIDKSNKVQNEAPTRILFLDSFRGIAIALVIVYHAFTRWSAIVPYGGMYAQFPLFANGNLGVQLFFIISGFVIMMTLEKCKSFTEFICRRWLRLFPAMVAATVLIYLTADILHERPLGQPNLVDLLPGLFFIEPNWISHVFRIPVVGLDGSFWSLFVEVKYYFIFGGMYFLFGKKNALIYLFSMYLLSLFAQLFSFFVSGNSLLRVNWLFNQLSFQHFGWFVAGSFYYLFYFSRKVKFLGFAIGVASVSALGNALGQAPTVLICEVILLLIVTAAIYSKPFSSFLETKILQFLGFISYPLYLIHQNAMVALIIKEDRLDGILPYLFFPVIPIFILITISYCLARYVEPIFKKILHVGLSRIKIIR